MQSRYSACLWAVGSMRRCYSCETLTPLEVRFGWELPRDRLHARPRHARRTSFSVVNLLETATTTEYHIHSLAISHRMLLPSSPPSLVHQTCDISISTLLALRRAPGRTVTRSTPL